MEELYALLERVLWNRSGGFYLNLESSAKCSFASIFREEIEADTITEANSTDTVESIPSGDMGGGKRGDRSQPLQLRIQHDSYCEGRHDRILLTTSTLDCKACKHGEKQARTDEEARHILAWTIHQSGLFKGKVSSFIYTCLGRRTKGLGRFNWRRHGSS